VQSNELYATQHISHGRVLVKGVGESTIAVNFPVWYIEVPTFTFGGELSEGHPPMDGQYPVFSASVMKWRVLRPDRTLNTGGLRKYYRGARLALVQFGPDAQDFWFHWQFVGMAITNPVRERLNLEEEI
jgi:hypothetical protein